MTVRVGFLGAGLIATFHSKMLRHSGEDVAWAGVWDPDPDRRDAFARASGAIACPSEDAVLDTCDALYVCTWTAEHPRLVAEAVARGLAGVLREAAGHRPRGRPAMAAAVERPASPTRSGWCCATRRRST